MPTDAPTWQPNWTPPDFPHVEEALNAEATIIHEHGQWNVYLHVLLASGSVRHHVSTQYDERRAIQAARIIEKTARRYIPNPPPTNLPDIPRLPAASTTHPFTWTPPYHDYIPPQPGAWISLGRFR